MYSYVRCTGNEFLNASCLVLSIDPLPFRETEHTHLDDAANNKNMSCFNQLQYAALPNTQFRPYSLPRMPACYRFDTALTIFCNTPIVFNQSNSDKLLLATSTLNSLTPPKYQIHHSLYNDTSANKFQGHQLQD